MDACPGRFITVGLSVLTAKSLVVSALMHIHMHAYTPNQPQRTSFFFKVLCLSQWGLIFMAALRSKKTGTSLLLQANRRHQAAGWNEIYALTCLFTQSCFTFEEGFRGKTLLSAPQNLANSQTSFFPPRAPITCSKISLCKLSQFKQIKNCLAHFFYLL